MEKITVDYNQFKFTYLPEYARFLLDNKLEEFVTIGVRFLQEVNFPLLKSLGRYNEKQLVALALDSMRETLEHLSLNTVGSLIETRSRSWVEDTLGVLKREQVAGEDITLTYHVRRKVFSYFLDAYTKNVVLQKLIIGEVDQYTSREELITMNIYLDIQREKLQRMNDELLFHKDLLLEAQELSGLGSFLINFREPEKSIYTPEYQRIFGLTSRTSFEQFFGWVHPDDRQSLQDTIIDAYAQGGRYEVEYRYAKQGFEKRIWSRGFILAEDHKPYLIRGVVKEI